MPTYPRISVIMPSYGQAEYIEASIRSVLDQGYPELEFIVIDGGSTDGTVDIIRRYADRISYWISEKDSGQSQAINKGLKVCSGELITWLCSDDTYLPGTLAAFSELYRQRPDAGLYHGKSILFGRDRREKVIGASHVDLPLRYFACIPFPQPGSFFSRHAMEKVGYLDESLHFAMDYDLFARIALAMPVVSTEQVFSRYRLHPGSKSMNQLEKFTAEWTKVFSRFINSVNASGYLVDLLGNSGFLEKSEKPFIHHKVFTELELNRIASIFLFNQLVIRYEMTQRKEALRIMGIIKSLDDEFYKHE
ncbi:MAG: glycosyltransferase family 2 protein, partial [Bacteroidota bacterium]